MAGLVGYDSSSGEEDVQQRTTTTAQKPQIPEKQDVLETEDEHPNKKTTNGPKRPTPPGGPIQPEEPAPEPRIGPSLPPDSDAAPPIGPSLPPPDAEASYPTDMDQDDDDDDAQAAASPEDATPSSPYTASRALLRNLTLPTVPSLDIPPSPPGPPSPLAAALDARFETFLALKRQKGTHFNARIAQSSALRSPAVTDKLLGFVGLGGGPAAAAAAQYATTLSTGLWDPAGFPEWAYRGPLRRSQDKVQKERARGPGEAVRFVGAAASGAASESGSRQGSRSGTPSRTVPPVTGKRKSRFDQV